MAMQLVTDLYFCGFVVFRVIAFTEQAHPFVVACLFLCIRALLQIGEAMLSFVLGENNLLFWNLNHDAVWFYG